MQFAKQVGIEELEVCFEQLKSRGQRPRHITVLRHSAQMILRDIIGIAVVIAISLLIGRIAYEAAKDFSAQITQLIAVYRQLTYSAI